MKTLRAFATPLWLGIGHCLCIFNSHPYYFISTTQPLGHWVGRMRYLKRQGKLDEDREERLEAIGFQFEMDKNDKQVKFSVVWNTSYEALKAFKEVNGHVEIPKGYKVSGTGNASTMLDGWITRQRKHYKDGKLPDHLKKKLVALGLNLGGRGRPFGIESEEAWSMNYKALALYCQKNGDSDVPEKYDEDRELGKNHLCPMPASPERCILSKPSDIFLSIR